MEDINALEKSLTARQRRFCELIENGMTATQAAQEAGFGKDKKSSAAIGCKLLKKDNINAYRRALARVKWEHVGMTPEKVSLAVMEIYRRCMEAEPVREWDSEAHEWVEKGKFTFNAKGALEALKLIGGELGMYSRRVEVSGRMGVEQYLASLPEDEKAGF